MMRVSWHKKIGKHFLLPVGLLPKQNWRVATIQVNKGLLAVLLLTKAHVPDFPLKRYASTAFEGIFLILDHDFRQAKSMKMLKTIPALPVQSIHASCLYYATKLGFTIRHQEESFAIAVRDDIEIHLWLACDKSWKWRSIFLALKPIWSGAETFIAGTASCRIEVKGVDELYEEYKRQGVLHSPDTVIVEQYWGHREFDAVDIHRNLLTFYEVI